MKASHINVFLEAAYKAISGIAGIRAKKKSIHRVEPDTVLQGICATVAITGDVSGKVIIVLPPETAIEMCSMSFHGLKLHDADREMMADSIREIASRIASDACTALIAENIKVRVEPPKIKWEFEETRVPVGKACLEIEIETKAGELSVVAAL